MTDYILARIADGVGRPVNTPDEQVERIAKQARFNARARAWRDRIKRR